MLGGCVCAAARYHVSIAQRQIREELNQRVEAEVRNHATLQKASYVSVGDGATLRVVQTSSGKETFTKALRGKDVEAYRAMFAQWDADGDGSISYTEFITVMKTVADRSGKPFSEKRVQAMFALADLDKNGAVDFAEFMVMQAQKADRSKLKLELDGKGGGAGGASESTPSERLGGATPLDKLLRKERKERKHSDRSHRKDKERRRAQSDEDGGSSVASNSRSASPSKLGAIDEDGGGGGGGGGGDGAAGGSLLGTEPVDLGPIFLREYLRFNKAGDGRLELEQFVALLEAALLRRGLRVHRGQLEGMFRAADFDEDGVVDLRQFVQLDSVKRYFDTLQRREIAKVQQYEAAQAAAQQQRAAAARAAPRRCSPPPAPRPLASCTAAASRFAPARRIARRHGQRASMRGTGPHARQRRWRRARRRRPTDAPTATRVPCAAS